MQGLPTSLVKNEIQTASEKKITILEKLSEQIERISQARHEAYEVELRAGAWGNHMVTHNYTRIPSSSNRKCAAASRLKSKSGYRIHHS